MKIRKRSRRVMRLRAWVPAKHRCPECGKRGPHWAQAGGSEIFGPSGFWTCAKFYHPVTGHRLD